MNIFSLLELNFLKNAMSINVMVNKDLMTNPSKNMLSAVYQLEIVQGKTYSLSIGDMLNELDKIEAL